MSELISGKDALIALANGENVEFKSHMSESVWLRAKELKASEILNHCMVLGGDKYSIEFRLKPRTITMNGIEVPAPFTAPENSDNSLMWYVLDTEQDRGYSQCRNPKHPSNLLGSWVCEEEIKQVVAALRQVLRGQKC